MPEPEKHVLLAVITERNGSRTVARMAAGTYEDMVALWLVADNRRRAGLDTYHEYVRPDPRWGRDPYHTGDRHLDYLAVRSINDLTLTNRYPASVAGRFSALLTQEGKGVYVRIYGNTYRGRAVRVTNKGAVVRFTARHESRERPFPIMPASEFDRGVHGADR